MEQVAIKLVQAAEQSVALFGERTTAISSLRALASECSRDDWDGSGAVALDPDAVTRAECFLRTLPDGVSMPECSAAVGKGVSLDDRLSKVEHGLMQTARRHYALEAFVEELDRVTRKNPFRIWNDIVG